MFTPETQMMFRNIRDILEFNRAGISRIPFNILQNEKEYVLNAVLPGFNREEIKVSLNGEYLDIVAKKIQEETINEDEKYNPLVLDWEVVPQAGRFKLPSNVDAEGIAVSLEIGILSVKIPKRVKTEKSFEIK